MKGFPRLTGRSRAGETQDHGQRRSRNSIGASVRFNLPPLRLTSKRSSHLRYSLINALQHVNREQESVTTNERVQACLTKAKADRKLVVRYIQLVDMDADGDFIGTLIATNEQVSESESPRSAETDPRARSDRSSTLSPSTIAIPSPSTLTLMTSTWRR